MSAGLLLGLQRPAAAKFGFLLAVPAVVASGSSSPSKGIISAPDQPFAYVAIATLIAFVVGYAAIAWFLRYLAHHSVRLFVIYRAAARECGPHPRRRRGDQLTSPVRWPSCSSQIDDSLRAFIEAQPMFFVADRPDRRGGHVNLSPKGVRGPFRVTGPRGSPTST